MIIRTADATLEFMPEGDPASSPSGPPGFRHAAPIERPPVTFSAPARRTIIAALGIAVTAFAWGALAGGESTTPTGTLHVESDPAGAEVVIDGSSHGVTPLSMTLPPGRYSMLVRLGGHTRQTTVDIDENAGKSYHLMLGASSTAGAATGAQPDVKSGETGTRVRAAAPAVVPVAPPGWITVDTPFSVQVAEGGRLLGASPGRVMLQPGPHELLLVSEPFGFRETVQVRISSGRGEAISLTIPTVAMNINALPWAEVFIDGTRIGDTPLANVMQPLGEHVILFRHPELGERQQVARVALGEPPRVTVDMREK